MAGASRGDLVALRVDGDVQHRDELAADQLLVRDLVRVREEVARLGMLACQRAKDELGQAMSAVASIPWPATSPSTAATRPSGRTRKS